MDVAYTLLAALAAYLIGSLSFAVIVSRAMGLNDPRTYGSKNPGATNVLRSGSKAAAVVTLLLDAVKGWLPVVLVRWYGPAWGLGDGAVAWWVWLRSSGICTRCSSASRGARAWLPHWGCCWASTGCWAWPRR